MSTEPENLKDVSTCLGWLRVRISGRGPSAVVWHSLFVDSRSWERVQADLGRRRTLVLIDGPSNGQSQPATRRFTLDDCAHAAAEILDQLSMNGPVDWVGNAWGDHVGMASAAEYPQRVRSLIPFASPVAALSAAGPSHSFGSTGCWGQPGSSAPR